MTVRVVELTRLGYTLLVRQCCVIAAVNSLIGMAEFGSSVFYSGVGPAMSCRSANYAAIS